SDITGDSRIDSITSARTLKKDSETQTVQYNVRECFENREGDCDIPHRIYGLTRDYHGLEALFGLFTQSTSELVTKADPETQIDLLTKPVQMMGSLLIYDLKGGCEQYRLAIVEEQKETTNLLETLLILFFIIAIISTFIGFIFFLL
ncbi:MAG: hypothetical protein EZS28_055210, partial [Streblomastix strix]